MRSMQVKLCECGCGNPAPIAKKTQKKLGHIKGMPIRFIAGHNFASTHPGVTYRKDGYVLVQTAPGKRELEHRVIVEKQLGHKLKSTEIVHHKNSKRDDNSPDNLEVAVGHAGHVQIHTIQRHQEVPPNSKRCSLCNEIKPFDEFYKNRSKPYGLCSECKTCHGEARRERNRIARDFK